MFELRWNTPHDNGERIDFYEVRYCEVRDFFFIESLFKQQLLYFFFLGHESEWCLDRIRNRVS